MFTMLVELTRSLLLFSKKENQQEESLWGKYSEDQISNLLRYSSNAFGMLMNDMDTEDAEPIWSDGTDWFCQVCSCFLPPVFYLFESTCDWHKGGLSDCCKKGKTRICVWCVSFGRLPCEGTSEKLVYTPKLDEWKMLQMECKEAGYAESGMFGIRYIIESHVLKLIITLGSLKVHLIAVSALLASDMRARIPKR